MISMPMFELFKKKSSGDTAKKKRLALVGRNNNILIVRHHPDQVNRKDFNHIVARHHIAALYHIGAQAVDEQVCLLHLMCLQKPYDAVSIAHGGNFRRCDDSCTD